MKSPNKLSNGRPTIGILLGSMSSLYQDKILKGAASAARKKDYNIIGFSGGPLNSSDLLSQSRSTLFDTIDTKLLDGLIIPVGSLARHLNDEQTLTFLDRFKDIPIVNIGGIIPGLTNIVADYAPGLIATIEHFVNVHGYKHIAFFRGPSHHASSNLREQIYRETLTKLNIPINENLIVIGDLKITAANVAVSELLDIRHQSCDAIICVNDSIALGVLNSLNDRHINVPEDIAISGSLDNIEGLFSDPPLTTIREPLFELGFAALNAMSSRLEGHTSPSDIFIPTEMLIRNSCGCKTTSIPKPNSFELIKNSHYSTIEEEWQALYQATLDQINQVIDAHQCLRCAQYIDQLLPLFYRCARDNDFSSFFSVLIKQIEKMLKTPDIIPWMKILAIFEYTGIELFRLVKDRKIIENYLENISLIIEDMTHKALIYQSSKTDFHINFSRTIVNNLNSSFNFDSIKSYAVDLLDLTELYIATYDTNTTDRSMLTNVMAVRNKKPIAIPSSQARYPAKSLIPQSVDLYSDRYDLIIFPLSFRKKPLGILTLNLSNRKGTTYENMQVIISTALKNESQIQELREAETRFSDIAHSTSDWLWETDSNHIFTYSSSSVEDTIGYTIDEIIGHNISENTIKEWVFFYSSMKELKSLVNTETWFRHKNGNLVCLLISSTPIFKDNCFIGYRGVFKNITDKRLQEDKIKHLAYYDILTGLANRSLFQEKLDALSRFSKQTGSKFALLFLDLDRFKNINDSMGHANGDKVLSIIGSKLQEVIRVGDTIARLSGDEFTILLPNISNVYEAVLIAKKLINAINSPIKIDNKQLFVTISIGIAVYPTDGKSSGVILKNADTAMHIAKSRGRNRYVFYDPQIDEQNTSRIHFEEILYRALKDNNFHIQYQPKINTSTKELTGFEALVRINDPIEGMISPIMFIDIAEELGLIDKIDELVVTMVCQQLKQWQEDGHKILTISVNLSPHQLKQRHVFDQYLKIVDTYGINHNMIEIEITENALIANEELALDILTRFAAAGFSIALDDFGTGYSSLSSLSLYPFSTIKIDKIFIQNIWKVKSNLAIIKAIIQMSHNLNMKIVAEGVENKDQYDLIKSLACTEIQGYYFSKPVDPDRALDILINGL